MASSDNLQRCSKCYRYQDTSSFVSKTGRKLKSCKICRDQSSFIYNIQKSSQNNHKTKEPGDDSTNENNVEAAEENEISLVVMQEMIFNKVNTTAQNDFLENEYSELDFTCTISTNSLEGTPQERAKEIIKTITKGDGYHYM